MVMVFDDFDAHKGCLHYYKDQITELENREKKLLAVLKDTHRRAEKALELCSLDDTLIQMELANILLDCEEYVFVGKE
jgi:hypothetical protein